MNNKRDHLLARCKLASVFSEARGAMSQESQIRLVVDEYGDKRYYNSENQLHRADGPAVIYSGGDKDWYLNGELHRTDGPAAIYPNGEKYWYINGNLLTEAEFLTHPLCTIK